MIVLVEIMKVGTLFAPAAIMGMIVMVQTIVGETILVAASYLLGEIPEHRP